MSLQSQRFTVVIPLLCLGWSATSLAEPIYVTDDTSTQEVANIHLELLVDLNLGDASVAFYWDCVEQNCPSKVPNWFSVGDYNEALEAADLNHAYLEAELGRAGFTCCWFA